MTIRDALAALDLSDGDEVEIYTLRSVEPRRFVVHDVTRREIERAD